MAVKQSSKPKKTARVQVPMTPRQKRDLEAFAEKAGIPLAVYMLAASLKAAGLVNES
jgi:hypothetical protein